LFPDLIQQIFIQQLLNLVCSIWRVSFQVQMLDAYHCLMPWRRSVTSFFNILSHTSALPYLNYYWQDSPLLFRLLRGFTPQEWFFGGGIWPPKWGAISSRPPKDTNGCRNTSYEPL